MSMNEQFEAIGKEVMDAPLEKLYTPGFIAGLALTAGPDSPPSKMALSALTVRLQMEQAKTLHQVNNAIEKSAQASSVLQKTAIRLTFVGVLLAVFMAITSALQLLR